jgi:HD-like signal output (HDOD) protein
MAEMFVVEESLTAIIAARVDSDEFKLPVFNQVALEVQNAINANAQMQTIEEIVLKDQALASEILRVANSAFFAGLAKQQNVHQALVRLGVNRVVSLVMMAAQRQAYTARHPFLAQVMKKLWQHSAASAGACRWVAEKCGYKNLAESAFLAGLFHDLGSLVVLKVLDEVCLTYEGPELTDAVIMEVISSLHTEYGFRVMQSWHLPSHYSEVARDHHNEGLAAKSVLLQIVRLVDAACAQTGIGMTCNRELVLEALPEAQALGIRDVHLAELEIQLEELVEQFG